MSASTSAVPNAPRYDVFLSFRGEDTRLNFTDHLYSTLIQRGIATFRDEESLVRGGPIPDSLVNAIEQSRFCVVVFSKNYSSSCWCLTELEKIYGCANSNGRPTVLPVFYDVAPSDVRKQRGSFDAAFSEHERVYGKDSATVRKWRKALKEVASLSGWDLRNRHHSVVLQEIVRKIFYEVNSELPLDQEGLVGVVLRAGKLLDKLLGGSDDPSTVGIVGMCGIGKTTIARVVYERKRAEFAGCSFLANVRERAANGGLVSLQEQLLQDLLKDERIHVPDPHRGINMIRTSLKSLKVLVVIDDVGDRDQLEALAGNRHCLGPGSRVLVTTRNVHLLFEHGVKDFFSPMKLDSSEALRLFSLRAFQEDHPPEPYLKLSRRFVEYTCGLPLAVTVLGSLLFEKSIDEWNSMLDRLKTMPEKEINDVLKVSFDGLHPLEKEIFLDIACFFDGEDEDRVMKILDACELRPVIGMRNLKGKCLISNMERKLRMHNLLRQMGKEIVRQESPKEPGRRSRLCSFREARDVLENNEGSRLVEAVYLRDSANKSAEEATSIEVHPRAFKEIRKLRLLKLRRGNISDGLQYLPNELRYLEWHDYRLRSLPLGFYPRNLVELRLPNSRIVKLNLGPKPLKNLTHLDLSYSRRLIESPDFSLLPNLEELSLAGCVGLSEIHQSIDVLERLTVLNLDDCKNLVWHLSKEKRARIYIISLCRREHNSFSRPEVLGDSSFSVGKEQQSRTWRPSARDHPRASGVPLLDALSNFHLLRRLNLSNCNLPDNETPIDLSCVSLLQDLDLKGNCFTRVPFDISGLDRLDNLWFSDCKRLEVLPKLPGNIRTVAANHCIALRALPDDIGLGSSGQCDFSFIECHQLIECTTNGWANRLLKSILQKLLQIVFKDPDRGRAFNFYLPGSRVPRWFNCRSRGAMTVLKLDPDWFDDSFRGFALCAVFRPNSLENGSFCSYDFNYSIKVDGVEESPSTSTVALKSFGTIRSNHLWVSYVFRRQWACYNGDPEGVCPLVKVQFHTYDPVTEVIGCGIHPVYSNETGGPHGFLGSAGQALGWTGCGIQPGYSNETEGPMDFWGQRSIH